MKTAYWRQRALFVAGAVGVAGWSMMSSTSAATDPVAAVGDCTVKGNVTAIGERIYHVPGQRYYSATQIDPTRGERWFCSEADARVAGWRPSMV
jgi:hypothetical protein